MKNGLLFLVLFFSLSTYAQQQSAVVNGKLTSLQNEQYPKYHLKDFKNLDSLSNIYFEMGDEQFLIIDAYKDGLIKLNDFAAFEFSDNILTLNKQFIPEPYNSKYLDKIKTIQRKEHLVCAGCTFRFLLGPGEGVHGEDAFVYEPHNEIASHNSRLNVNFDPSVNSYLEHRRNDSLLIHSLYLNHIISNTNTVHIRYSATQFYVNDVKLENLNLLHDYKALVEKINNTTPVDENDFYGLYFDKKDVQQFCKN